MPLSSRENVQKRFDDKYTPEPNSGCWLWVGSVSNRYGKISVNYKKMGAHRVSYELHKGRVPNDMCVLHKCDIPTCVKPDHLFLGTQAENIRDMVTKGRARAGSYGECCNFAKLNNFQVRVIKNLLKTSTLFQWEIADLFNVSAPNISDINTGKIWSST